MKDIRKEVKKYIDTAGDKTVRLIYAMLEADKKEEDLAEKTFLNELDSRTAEFEKGKAKLFTLDQLETNARKSYKQQRNTK